MKTGFDWAELILKYHKAIIALLFAILFGLGSNTIYDEFFITPELSIGSIKPGAPPSLPEIAPPQQYSEIDHDHTDKAGIDHGHTGIDCAKSTANHVVKHHGG